MFWLQKLRLRVFALLVALTIGVFTVVGVLSVPPLAAISVAVVAAVTMVNSMTTKLSAMTCSGCGKDISKIPMGTYGVTCPGCGTTTQPYNHADLPALYASDDSNADQDSGEADSSKA